MAKQKKNRYLLWLYDIYEYDRLYNDFSRIVFVKTTVDQDLNENQIQTSYCYDNDKNEHDHWIRAERILIADSRCSWTTNRENLLKFARLYTGQAAMLFVKPEVIKILKDLFGSHYNNMRLEMNRIIEMQTPVIDITSDTNNSPIEIKSLERYNAAVHKKYPDIAKAYFNNDALPDISKIINEKYNIY